MTGPGNAVRTYREDDCTTIPEDSSSTVALEWALADEMPVIVIQDKKLSSRTARWMNTGQLLDGMSFGIALVSIACSMEPVEELGVAGKPLAILSILLHLGYHVWWVQEGELIHYRMVQGPGSNSPSTILEREGDVRCLRRYFFWMTSVVAATVAFWELLPLETVDAHKFYDKIKYLCGNGE